MDRSRTIVVGYDGSPEAARAVTWAARHASGRGCQLLLVHCSLWPLLTHNLGPVPGVANSGLERSAQITLEEGLSHARQVEPDLEIETKLVHGLATEHLRTISAGTEMLVVGSRGLGGFMGLLVGSVSLELAATAVCPVAVIHPEDHPDGPVVVGVDRSGSPAAVEDACRLASATQASLIIVHVRRTSPSFRHVRDSQDTEAAGEDVLDAVVETAHTFAPDITVEGKLLTDASIPRAILNVSKGARLVAVGTKGHGLIRETIGSTAHAVLHHARGPVLISRRAGSEARPGPSGGF